MIWLSVAVAALGALDIGNLYFARRQLQRTADLAALAAAQVIGSAGGCAAAGTAAQLNATSNGLPANGTLTTTCGRWDTSTSTYFGATGNPLNAVQVQATQAVPMFFIGPTRNATATATAQATNIDAFSLSTGIATINTQQSALLNAILGGLLKTSVGLTVGNFQSLASAQIKLENLMVALGASSMQGLLSTTVSYQTLMVAMVQALQAGGDTVDAAILQTLAVTVPGAQNITIGDNGTGAPGLLALGLSNPNSAATATVNALDALMVAAQIAQRSPDGTAGNAPVINVTTGLAGIAGLSLQIINPPVLAVGEGGTTMVNGVSTPRTMARTASVNASVTLTNPLPTLSLGVATISALSSPIVLNLAVAPGKAVLTNVDCESTKAATNATIQVTPSVASLCVGTNASCGGPITLANISVLLIGNVASVQLNALGPFSLTPGSTPIVFNGASGSFNLTQSANSNPVGSDAAALTTPLLAALPSALHIQVLGNYDLSALLAPLLSLVTTTLTPLLQSVFTLLDSIVVPTLSLLGIQIGTATVHNMSLTCGVPQLVN
ncbi:TadG family pilus assembly protein [Paraburkholderia sp. D15]|uniref:TadG family pilus assembly protein n=1 Tax=Paraburkholderia sp. D15 TaxID=2880218 RepID=UPI00247AAB2C|nr:TadG family pilus assembly protein [Paraburkholderia sp. D15]WGS51403.1 TadG family pilus assembly protein [Paraburkholderia sp. D15]